MTDSTPAPRITSVTALSGIPPHLHGGRGELAYAQAIYQASNSQAVFPENVSLNHATTDLAAMRRIHESEPDLNWFLRAKPEDGLVALRFADSLARATCEKMYGAKLPRTLTIERGETSYWIFLRGMAGPRYLTHRDVVKGVRAQVVTTVPLHGNRHHKSGETYRWREYCAPGECVPAFLPRAFVIGLPKRLGSMALSVERRHEWRPPTSPRWCG